jgi:hypothetical protein
MHLRKQNYKMKCLTTPPQVVRAWKRKRRGSKVDQVAIWTKQAPKMFYEKLSAGLLEHGFTKSKDACMFMKRGLLFVICVDDTIFTGPDEDQLAQEIIGLGVSKFETQHNFQLCDEGEFEDLLGI